MRLVFFGTNEFAVPALQILAKHFNIPFVVTKSAKLAGREQKLKSSPIEVEAKKMGLTVLNPDKFDSKFGKLLKSVNPDLFVMVDYGKIIPLEIIKIPPRGSVNIHPSKLPKYRGASPIQTAILNGEKETAISIMLIDDKMDHGPILAQKKSKILTEDTYSSLYKRLSAEYPDFLLETLEKYLSGEILPYPQDDTKATLTKILTREDGCIDWSKSAEEIERMVRAYNPWPGTHFMFSPPCHSEHSPAPEQARYGINSAKPRNLMIKIIACSLEHKNYPDKKAGELFKNSAGLLAVKCGSGALIIDRLQPEGKKPMTGEEFARGYLKIKIA